MPTTVVFIHGAWLTPASWDRFRGRFESRGYETIAPPWPFNDRPIEELRRAPDPGLAQLTIGKLADHFEQLVRAMPEPPILVGHSFGGLLVQKLMDRGLGSVVVAIDPVPPRFVQPRPITLLSTLPVLTSWMGWRRTLTMSFEQFAKNFAGDVPPGEQQQAYQRYIVPTPGRLLFQDAAHIGDRVHWGNRYRAPLLLIAGEKDRTVEASMVRAAYKAYSRRSTALTEFKEFPNRSHFLINSPGWEQVADYAINWVSRYAAPTRRPRPERGSRTKDPRRHDMSKVLMVLTSHDRLGTTGRKTGFWLEEFATPYYILKDAGLDVTLASPKGGQPPIDPKSDDPGSETESMRRFKGDKEAQAALAHTVTLSDVSPEDYDAVFYPGGHGPLWDLSEDRRSITLIETMYAAGKPVGAVCHGPAAFRHAKAPDGSPLVRGKSVTGFSNSEEAAVGLTDVVPFLVEENLKQNGGEYSKVADWQPYAVTDRNLITGQNPASSEPTAKALLAQLVGVHAASGSR